MTTKEESANFNKEQMEKRDQVKRPMNAFMLWSKEKRRKISSVDPSLHNSHISKILGEEWKQLPIKDKEPYIQESKSLMEKHKKDHPDYHYKPRQNKLTKALKQLSSLHAPLPSSPGLASKLRSNLSAFVSVPPKPYYQSCPTFYRSHMVQKHRRVRDNVLYHDMPPYYTPAVSCKGCSRSTGCAESVWMAQQPHGCSCSMECPESMWMERRRYSPHERSLADFPYHPATSSGLFQWPSKSVQPCRQPHEYRTYPCFAKNSREDCRSWDEETDGRNEIEGAKSRSPYLEKDHSETFSNCSAERSETPIAELPHSRKV